MVSININAYYFDIEAKDGLFYLFRVTKFASGDVSHQILGHANIKQLKEKIIKVAHSNNIEVSEKLREVGL